MTDRLQPTQILGLRWVVLQAACAAVPFAATEQMLMDAAQAAYPTVGHDRLRAELDYLESAGLVTATRSEIKPWRVKPTPQGRDVESYVIDAPEGVGRPLVPPGALR